MPVDATRLTICLPHADPQASQGSQPFATGSPGLHEAWNAARRLVSDFDPELVMFFGTDHRRAFREVIPTVAVALAASARGDRGGPVGEYQVPSEVSRLLATGLVDRDIDVAVAYHPQLDHAFGLTARDLLGGPSAFPTVPVFLWPEDERLARNARLNAELRVPGRTFSDEWDREFLAGLATTDDAWLGTVGQDVAGRGGNGANETVTWVAAWAACHQPLAALAYEFDEQFGSGTAVAVSATATTADVRPRVFTKGADR